MNPLFIESLLSVAVASVVLTIPVLLIVFVVYSVLKRMDGWISDVWPPP